MAAKAKNGLNVAHQTDVKPAPSVVVAQDTPPAPRLKLPAISNGSQKLARTFQKLVGGAPKPTLTAFTRAWLATLTELGFEPDLQTRILTHPIFERTLKMPAFNANHENAAPEIAALDFAIKNLPELEFYLPYISLRARLAATNLNHSKKLLTPEPDYDDDGFLVE